MAVIARIITAYLTILIWAFPCRPEGLQEGQMSPTPIKVIKRHHSSFNGKTPIIYNPNTLLKDSLSQAVTDQASPKSCSICPA